MSSRPACRINETLSQKLQKRKKEVGDAAQSISEFDPQYYHKQEEENENAGMIVKNIKYLSWL